MHIEDLTPEQSITLLVTVGDQKLEFPSLVLDFIPRKHMILAAPVLKNDKIISFSGKGITVHLVVSFSDKKPHIFYNVTIQTAKREDGTFCYMIASEEESKEFNRRGAFRCFVGINALIFVGTYKDGIRGNIKDVSTTGFSFTSYERNKEFKKFDVVQTELNDYIEETGQKYSFTLYGTIVRSYSLENNIVVYGCQFGNKIPSLERYLMEKERIRLQKSRGANNFPLK
mgnify:FL=1